MPAYTYTAKAFIVKADRDFDITWDGGRIIGHKGDYFGDFDGWPMAFMESNRDFWDLSEAPEYDDPEREASLRKAIETGHY